MTLSAMNSRSLTAKKKLMFPGFPAAHPVPAYRCFLPDLTGFTGRGCAGPGPM